MVVIAASRFRDAPRARVLGVEAIVADRRALRLLGLSRLPRELAPAALLIPRCRSIHTFGLRFPIDVVFLDGEGMELDRVDGLPPRRFAGRRGASAVLELPRWP
jgi:hypothetical protein